jgi:hypothetical protein
MAQEVPVTMTTSPRDEDSTPLRIRRGRVDSVDLYEIKDSELDQLERGSPADLQLNFAVFLLSLGFAAIGSLATAKFSSDTVHELFLIVAVGGLVAGAYLLIAWTRNRVSNRDLCRRIRDRIPPDIVRSLNAADSDLPPNDTDPAGG